MLGIKQEALAHQLGQDWSQKKVSQVEAKEQIENELLEEIPQALDIPAEAFRNFSEDKAIQIISNSFHDTSMLNGILYNPSFHPLDNLLETIEENKKLYERLLQSEREKNELLQQLLKSK